jgi:glycosyltransferase involved in cell wall biosynthesis
MKLSVIVPAHNEQDNIKDVLIRLESAIKGEYELLVVQDHCTDLTAEFVRELARDYRNIRLVENNLEAGFANAIRTGLNNARGDALIMIMADLCDDPETINVMLGKINDGYDVVCGSRYIEGGRRLGGSKIKGFFSRFLGCSLYYLLSLPTHDSSNAFKMYRRKAIEGLDIRSRSFEISMELLLKAYFSGARITEVPTVWRERTKGKSTFKMLKLFPNYLKLYIWAMAMVLSRMTVTKRK